jgi:hypothetical protein
MYYLAVAWKERMMVGLDVISTVCISPAMMVAAILENSAYLIIQ